MNRQEKLPHENVVTRLRRRLSSARADGLNVRMELLDGEQATWCEIGGVPTLFVDISLPAAEQLLQVEAALEAYSNRHGGCQNDPQQPATEPDVTTRAA